MGAKTLGKDCCQNKSEDLKSLVQTQSRVLWTVLVINLIMFFVEIYSSYVAHSLALAGDSLDMFGDTLAYGSSLLVLDWGMRAKVRSAQFKAGLMIFLGLIVLGQAIYRAFFQVTPEFEVMSSIGLLALVANLFCLYLLTKHRNDDINFRSVWVCSRNDIIANISVLLAAGTVYLSASPWPDLIVGLGITVLFIRSAISILRESNLKLHHSVY